jgi:hypothetical protein
VTTDRRPKLIDGRLLVQVLFDSVETDHPAFFDRNVENETTEMQVSLKSICEIRNLVIVKIGHFLVLKPRPISLL